MAAEVHNPPIKYTRSSDHVPDLLLFLSGHDLTLFYPSSQSRLFNNKIPQLPAPFFHIRATFGLCVFAKYFREIELKIRFVKSEFDLYIAGVCGRCHTHGNTSVLDEFAQFGTRTFQSLTCADIAPKLQSKRLLFRFVSEKSAAFVNGQNAN